MAKPAIPTFALEHPGLQEPGQPPGWTVPMTTDVLLDQFDFGEADLAELDRAVANVPVGQTVDLACHYLSDPDASWTQTLRRCS